MKHSPLIGIFSKLFMLGKNENVCIFKPNFVKRSKLFIFIVQHCFLINSLLDYSSDHAITQPMIWHFLYQTSQVGMNGKEIEGWSLNVLGVGLSSFVVFCTYGCKKIDMKDIPFFDKLFVDQTREYPH